MGGGGAGGPPHPEGRLVHGYLYSYLGVCYPQLMQTYRVSASRDSAAFGSMSFGKYFTRRYFRGRGVFWRLDDKELMFVLSYMQDIGNLVDLHSLPYIRRVSLSFLTGSWRVCRQRAEIIARILVSAMTPLWRRASQSAVQLLECYVPGSKDTRSGELLHGAHICCRLSILLT